MAPDNIHFLAVCRYITSVFFCVLALAAIKISYTVLRHVTLVLPDFVSVVQTKVWTSFPSIPPRVHVVVFIVCVLVDPPLFLVYITCIIFLPLWLAAIRISYAVARHVIIRLPAFVEVVKAAFWGSFTGISVWLHVLVLLFCYGFEVEEAARRQSFWYYLSY